jgi:hypothetical protein
MKFYKNRHRIFRSILLLLLLLSTLVWAQATGQQVEASWLWTQEQSQAKASQGETKSSGQAGASQGTTETKISPKEAEELFRSVDEIMKFASQDTDLPIHHPVKRRLTSRDEVTAYLEKHMVEDEDAQRLKRSELVLKKFGLLPRDYDLGKFLLALLREQVAGYYDPKTRTVNLLDWLDLEQQRPVLAHELTHALQDQSFGLEKWMKAAQSDLALKKKDPTPEEIQKDESQTARQAVVEGQAMAVLVDYLLAPMGQSLLTSPRLVEALKQGMLTGTADSVQFHNAPIFLKETLTFPYRYGIDFVAAVLSKEGKEKAYAGMFRNPPTTTREVMQPETYLSGEHIEPMPVPEFSRLMKNYEKFDVGSIGEFDVSLLVDEYAGTDLAQQVYPHWRGGYYYAAKRKGDPSAPLALLYVSRWSSPQSAAGFARIYATSLKKRYRSMRWIPDTTRQENTPGGDEDSAKRAESFAGVHHWETDGGDVIVDVEGDKVFVAESFDAETSTRLRDAIMVRPAAAAAGN